MIDEQKLLCAFTYSAYASGYCGLTITQEQKKQYMEQYENYIKTGQNFPEEAIELTREKMRSVDITDPRDYIYSGHFKIVMKRIAEETGKDFYTAIKNPMILMPAINCPANFYKVCAVRRNKVVGNNSVTGKKKELTILDGLEIPKPGQIISSHWDYEMEVIDDALLLKKYIPRVRAYLDRIRENL